MARLTENRSLTSRRRVQRVRSGLMAADPPQRRGAVTCDIGDQTVETGQGGDRESIRGFVASGFWRDRPSKAELLRLAQPGGALRDRSYCARERDFTKIDGVSGQGGVAQ